jgi:hypothetical protein
MRVFLDATILHSASISSGAIRRLLEDLPVLVLTPLAVAELRAGR